MYMYINVISAAVRYSLRVLYL